jgi:hypothetical protein
VLWKKAGEEIEYVPNILATKRLTIEASNLGVTTNALLRVRCITRSAEATPDVLACIRTKTFDLVLPTVSGAIRE